MHHVQCNAAKRNHSVKKQDPRPEIFLIFFDALAARPDFLSQLVITTIITIITIIITTIHDNNDNNHDHDDDSLATQDTQMLFVVAAFRAPTSWMCRVVWLA